MFIIFVPFPFVSAEKKTTKLWSITNCGMVYRYTRILNTGIVDETWLSCAVSWFHTNVTHRIKFFSKIQEESIFIVLNELLLLLYAYGWHYGDKSLIKVHLKEEEEEKKKTNEQEVRNSWCNYLKMRTAYLLRLSQAFDPSVFEHKIDMNFRNCLLSFHSMTQSSWVRACVCVYVIIYAYYVSMSAAIPKTQWVTA